MPVRTDTDAGTGVSPPEPDLTPQEMIRRAAALRPLLTQESDAGYRLALGAYDEVENVMAALRSAGARVQEMEVMQPDLEEVFVKIMNR